AAIRGESDDHVTARQRAPGADVETRGGPPAVDDLGPGDVDRLRDPVGVPEHRLHALLSHAARLPRSTDTQPLHESGRSPPCSYRTTARYWRRPAGVGRC